VYGIQENSTYILPHCNNYIFIQPKNYLCHYLEPTSVHRTEYMTLAAISFTQTRFLAVALVKMATSSLVWKQDQDA